jgi:hypothetical protein
LVPLFFFLLFPLAECFVQWSLPGFHHQITATVPLYKENLTGSLHWLWTSKGAVLGIQYHTHLPTYVGPMF